MRSSSGGGELRVALRMCMPWIAASVSLFSTDLVDEFLRILA